MCHRYYTLVPSQLLPAHALQVLKTYKVLYKRIRTIIKIIGFMEAKEVFIVNVSASTVAL